MNQEVSDQKSGTVKADRNDCNLDSFNMDESDGTCSPAKQQRVAPYQANQSWVGSTDNNSTSNYSSSASQNMQQDEEPEDSDERKAAIRARLAKMGARSMIPGVMPALPHAKQPHQTPGDAEGLETGRESDKHIKSRSDKPIMSMMAELERKISVKKKVGPPVAVKKRLSDVENQPISDVQQEKLQEGEVDVQINSEPSIDSFWQNPADVSQVENVIISSSLESVQRKEEMLDVGLARNRANLASQRRAKPSTKLRSKCTDIDFNDAGNKSAVGEPIAVVHSIGIEAVTCDDSIQSESPEKDHEICLPSVTQTKLLNLSNEEFSPASIPPLKLSLQTLEVEDLQQSTHISPGKLLSAPVNVSAMSAAPTEQTLVAHAEKPVADSANATIVPELPALVSPSVTVSFTEAPSLLVAHQLVEPLSVLAPEVKSIKYDDEEEFAVGSVDSDEIKLGLIPSAQDNEILVPVKDYALVEVAHHSSSEVVQPDTGVVFASGTITSIESNEINVQPILLDLDMTKSSNSIQELTLLSSCKEGSGGINLSSEKYEFEFDRKQRNDEDFTATKKSEQNFDVEFDEFEIIDKDVIESEIQLANCDFKLPAAEQLCTWDCIETKNKMPDEVFPRKLGSIQTTGSMEKNGDLCSDLQLIEADIPIYLASKESTVNEVAKHEALLPDLAFKLESAGDKNANVDQDKTIPSSEVFVVEEIYEKSDLVCKQSVRFPEVSATMSVSLSNEENIIARAHSLEVCQNSGASIFCDVDTSPHELSSSCVSTLSNDSKNVHEGDSDDNTQVEEMTKVKVLQNEPVKVEIMQEIKTQSDKGGTNLLGDSELLTVSNITELDLLELSEMSTGSQPANVDWNEGRPTKLANDSDKVQVNLLDSKLQIESNVTTKSPSENSGLLKGSKIEWNAGSEQINGSEKVQVNSLNSKLLIESNAARSVLETNELSVGSNMDWNAGTKLKSGSEKVHVNSLQSLDSKLPSISNIVVLDSLENIEPPTDSPPALPSSKVPDKHEKPQTMKVSLIMQSKVNENSIKMPLVAHDPLKVTASNKNLIVGHKLEKPSPTTELNQKVKPEPSLEKRSDPKGCKIVLSNQSSNVGGVSTAVKVFNSIQTKGWIPPKTPPPSKVPEFTHSTLNPDSWRSRLRKVDSKALDLVPTTTVHDSPPKKVKEEDKIRSLPATPLRVKIPHIKPATDISVGELKSPPFMQEWERVRQQRQLKLPALKNTTNITQTSSKASELQVPEFMKLAAKFHSKHGVLADAEAR